eukprot:1400981-Pleurochrysis_carterae.AAC.1
MRATAALATPLGASFGPHARKLAPALLERATDKSRVVAEAVKVALEALSLRRCLSLSDVMDATNAAVSSSNNPHMRATVCAWLQKSVAAHADANEKPNDRPNDRPNDKPGESLTKLLPLLDRTLSPLVADAAPEVRREAFNAQVATCAALSPDAASDWLARMPLKHSDAIRKALGTADDGADARGTTETGTGDSTVPGSTVNGSGGDSARVACSGEREAGALMGSLPAQAAFDADGDACGVAVDSGAAPRRGLSTTSLSSASMPVLGRAARRTQHEGGWNGGRGGVANRAGGGADGGGGGGGGCASRNASARGGRPPSKVQHGAAAKSVSSSKSAVAWEEPPLPKEEELTELIDAENAPPLSLRQAMADKAWQARERRREASPPSAFSSTRNCLLRFVALLVPRLVVLLLQSDPTHTTRRFSLERTLPLIPLVPIFGFADATDSLGTTRRDEMRRHSVTTVYTLRQLDVWLVIPSFARWS